MTIQIRKAERTKSKLRLAIAGPSGSGKTMGSLKLAQGLGGKVCMIDTERGSGDLYSDLYSYDIISLEPPFKPDVLVEAVRVAEAAGYDVIIVDSLSHFWADEGGMLDMADKMQAAGKNRFTLWADITPQHRRLVNALLNSPKHIIATMRSKQAYEMEKDEKTGKSSVKKLGLAPVQREGMEYEFTVFFDVDQNHNATASKDRTNTFANEIFILNEDTGVRIKKWLETGKTDVRGIKRDIVFQLRDRLELGVPSDKNDAAEFIKMAVKKLTGLDVSDESKLEEILDVLVKLEDKVAAHKLVWEPKTPEKASEAAPAANASPAPAQKATEASSTAPGAVETEKKA